MNKARSIINTIFDHTGNLYWRKSDTRTPTSSIHVYSFSSEALRACLFPSRRAHLSKWRPFVQTSWPPAKSGVRWGHIGPKSWKVWHFHLANGPLSGKLYLRNLSLSSNSVIHSRPEGQVHRRVDSKWENRLGTARQSYSDGLLFMIWQCWKLLAPSLIPTRLRIHLIYWTMLLCWTKQ